MKFKKIKNLKIGIIYTHITTENFVNSLLDAPSVALISHFFGDVLRSNTIQCIVYLTSVNLRSNIYHSFLGTICKQSNAIGHYLAKFFCSAIIFYLNY